MILNNVFFNKAFISRVKRSFLRYTLCLNIPISNRLKREIDQNRAIYESLKYFKIF